MIHRLVAKYFVENEKCKSQVNHKDGNKTNNHFTNLEWVTDSENKLHCYKSGLKSRNVISKPVAQYEKYTDKIINIFESANECARVLKINQGNITNCCRGKCKSYAGFTFRYYKGEVID